MRTTVNRGIMLSKALGLSDKYIHLNSGPHSSKVGWPGFEFHVIQEG